MSNAFKRLYCTPLRKKLKSQWEFWDRKSNTNPKGQQNRAELVQLYSLCCWCRLVVCRCSFLVLKIPDFFLQHFQQPDTKKPLTRTFLIVAMMTVGTIANQRF